MSSLSIVIPTLNEEATLEDVILRCKPFADEILVIDGHSTDRTRDIAKRAGARIELDNGKGKGAALRRAVEQVNGDIIVFIDADGSHIPEDIPKLVLQRPTANVHSREVWSAGPLPVMRARRGRMSKLLKINVDRSAGPVFQLQNRKIDRRGVDRTDVALGPTNVLAVVVASAISLL